MIFNTENLMNVLEVKQPKIKNNKKSRKTAINLEKVGRSIGEQDRTLDSQNIEDFIANDLMDADKKNRTQAEWNSV